MHWFAIPTRDLLDSEHLAAMCQATHFDVRVCQERLRRLMVPNMSEVPRLAAMFSRMWLDRQARDGREQNTRTGWTRTRRDMGRNQSSVLHYR